MKNYPRLLALVSLLSLPAFAAPVGQFEEHVDVGAPKITGSATYDAAAQSYTFTAGGTNMWATRDEFHFAYKKLKGDFIVRARIEFVGQGVDPHRKVGWIARASLDADAPYVDGTEHGDRKLTSLQYRRTKGAITEQTQLKVTHADVLQLERRGNTYLFSAAKNGEVFETVELKDFDLGEEPFVGRPRVAHGRGRAGRAQRQPNDGRTGDPSRGRCRHRARSRTRKASPVHAVCARRSAPDLFCMQAPNALSNIASSIVDRGATCTYWK